MNLSSTKRHTHSPDFLFSQEVWTCPGLTMFYHVWLTVMSLCAGSHWRWHRSDSWWAEAANLCLSHQGFLGRLCKTFQPHRDSAKCCLTQNSEIRGKVEINTLKVFLNVDSKNILYQACCVVFCVILVFFAVRWFFCMRDTMGPTSTNGTSIEYVCINRKESYLV